MLDSLLVDRLIEILEKEVETYSRFLQLSREKTDIIINADIVKLENITKKEHILTNEMSKFEEAREQVMAEIIPHLVDKDFLADRNLTVDKEYLSDEDFSKITITSIIEHMKKMGKAGEIREPDTVQLSASQPGAAQPVTVQPETVQSSEKINVLYGEKHYLVQIEKLEKFKEIIIAIVNELKEINKINSNLLKNSIEFINFSINLLTSTNVHGAKYGNDGKEGNVERRSLFDVKL